MRQRRARCLQPIRLKFCRFLLALQTGPFAAPGASRISKNASRASKREGAGVGLGSRPARGLVIPSFCHVLIEKAKSSTNWTQVAYDRRSSRCHGARGPEKPTNLRRVSPQAAYDRTPSCCHGVRRAKNHENGGGFRAQVAHDRMTRPRRGPAAASGGDNRLSA